MLGHQNPHVTLKTYADLFDTDLDKVSAALDTARQKSMSKAGSKAGPADAEADVIRPSTSVYVSGDVAVAKGFEPYSAVQVRASHPV
jgi:2'-5' RNA ligase